MTKAEADMWLNEKGVDRWTHKGHRKQVIASLGLPYPPPKGWRRELRATLMNWNGIGESPFVPISIKKSKNLARKLWSERKAKTLRVKKTKAPKAVNASPAFMPVIHGWHGAYSAYLDSGSWRRKRKLIWTLHDGKCWATGQRACHVHHITYTRIYNEWICDLMPLSEEIHNEIHRQKGGTAMSKTIAVLGKPSVDAFIARYRSVTWEQAFAYAEARATFRE